MGIVMTESLEKVMTDKDDKLKENRVRSRLNKTKLKRSERLREKIITELKAVTLAAKEGKDYSSGAALETKSAKSIVLIALKEGRDLNKNRDKKDSTCKYYPIFCSHVGHSTAADKNCDMNGKSKDEKKSASDDMQELLIEKYLAEKKEGEKISVHICCTHIYVMYIIFKYCTMTKFVIFYLDYDSNE